MRNPNQPVASTWKKTAAIASVVVTAGALLISQNLTQVVASDEREFITASQVAAGNTFITVLSEEGEVYSRGWNSQGQLGVSTGSQVNISEWQKVALEETVTEIDAPYDHAVALTENGKIFTWGPNDVGQAGKGDTSPAYTPNQVKAALRFSQLTAGADFVLALDDDGKLWSWGANSQGQLGDGTQEDRAVPNLAATETTFTSIYANEASSYALTSEGELYAWGANDEGQLGSGDQNARLLPEPSTGERWLSLATNQQSKTVLGLRANNTVYAWGSNANGELGNGTDWRALQEEENRRVEEEIREIQEQDAARRENLILTCIDEQVELEEERRAEAEEERLAQEAAAEQIRPTPTPSPNPSGTPRPSATATPTPTPTPTAPVLPPINPNDYRDDCETDVDATFEPTDTSGIVPEVIEEPALQPSSSTPVAVTNATRVQDIALGTQNGYAVDTQGRLYAWGSDANGQTGINIDDKEAHTQVPVEIMTQVKSVAAGDTYAAAVTTRNAVFMWGQNSHGELLSTPETEPVLLTPTRKAEGYDSIIATANTVYAMKGNTVSAWGDNSQGQLGTGSNEETVVFPTELSSRLRTVAPYENGAVGLNLENQLVYWGANPHGEFGTGATSEDVVNTVTAKIVETFSTVKSGYLYSLAVDTTGQLWGWGSSELNLLGPVNGANSLYPIAVPVGSNITHVAAGQTVAIAANDTEVYVWGGSLGTEVQTYELSGVKQVAAGNNHVLVLTEDGTLWNWGDNSQGVNNQEEQMTLTEADVDNKYDFIAAGDGATFGIRTDGSLHGWGDNQNNILMFNDNNETTTTVNFTQVDAGQGYAAGVDENGVVWGWGYNPYGVFGIPTTAADPTALPLTFEENE